MNFLKKLIPKKIFKIVQPAYHYLMAPLAAFWYRYPSRNLIVIGVTGTTGKTSTVYLVAKALESAGYNVGYTSTAMFDDGKREWLNDKKMTMPGRFFVQKMLRRMVKNRCQYAIVETTSEGIVQFRHKFINYDILIFTGLYPEHIESHGGFEKYKEAKGRLFETLKKSRPKYVDDHKGVVHPTSALKKLDYTRVKKTIIVNGNDEHAPYFLNFWSEEQFIYSSQDSLDTDLFSGLDSRILHGSQFFQYKEVEEKPEGVSFLVADQKINLKLLGAFNVENALNAALTAFSQGVLWPEIKKGLEGVTCLSGKLEKIDLGQDFTIIVDYSFEPRALQKMYSTIKVIPHQKIIHVLGSCGGGRDKDRRPILGRLAGDNADYVIITNEDPYDEDPRVIIEEVAAGAEATGKERSKDLFLVDDRRQAIKKALSLADKDDLVLITGKGAEQYICLADGKKVPWDDRRIVREEFNALNLGT
ncbi:UDP-N-acetylmuramyl-tripeptide synthetase [Candidatus Falkowbacteria bacterium]|nr:UDP-N-acetylmuramyl-tripeptide synthetase [Patescibacteria group bacterium]MDD3435019.1 UDP-N-acetylmuramyl-tripeptide synthetase [Patescibacteria group bacterium]MDD4466220.1 UDP-N-acetylmuramyl-tripeptide synthetase [Patescibacteria group bacterium]NCU42878.1 UDP-N-acetylmuramyl-tripeptide synthetase [Candidatus Falkowbacteria bacterium]